MYCGMAVSFRKSFVSTVAIPQKVHEKREAGFESDL